MSHSSTVLSRLEILYFWLLFLIGQIYFVRDGSAYQLDGRISGYSWYNYLGQAWFVSERMPRNYNYFREPLYSGIVAQTGDLLNSYADGALLLSSIAGTIFSFCVGRVVWQLSDGFMGGWAAILASTSGGMLLVGRWGNHYPLMACCSALVLLGSVSWMKNRSLIKTVLLIVIFGVSTSIDQRLMVLGLPILLWAILVNKKKFWQGLLVFFGGLLTPKVFRWWFDDDPKHRLNIEQILDFQREVIHRWTTTSQTELANVCKGIQTEDLLRIEHWFSQCGVGMVVDNFVHRLPIFSSVPLGFSLFALLLLWSRTKERLNWKISVYLIGMSWFFYLMWSFSMPLPIRYMPQFAILMAISLPIGIFHGCQLINLSRVSSFFVSLLCVSCSFGYLHQSPDNFHTMKLYNKEQSKSLEVFDLLDRYRKDEPFLDCAEKGLNMYVLPQRYQEVLFHQIQDISPCRKWIERQDTRWILVNPNRTDGLYSALKNHKNWSIAIHFPENDFSIWKYTE
jgi:hypothetical protein